MSHFIESLLAETEAMVRHASGNGLPIPAHITADLYKMRCKLEAQEAQDEAQDKAQQVSETASTPEDVANANSPVATSSDPASSVNDQDTLFAKSEVAALTEHHQALAQIVSPAMPKTISLMRKEAENEDWLYFLGPVKLIRRLSIVAIAFLLTTITVAMSPDVNSTTINAGLFASEGFVLLLNQLFLLSCAGLGATFASLNRVSSYIKKGIYDPKYDATYWIMIIMGLMGGLIIAELLSVQAISSLASSEAGGGLAGGGLAGDSSATPPTPLENFDKPIAALLGGFSSDLIYRVLNRFVQLINQMIGGGNGDKAAEQNLEVVKEQMRQMQQKHQQQISATQKQQQDSDHKAARHRAVVDKQALVNQIGALSTKVESPADMERLVQQVEQIKRGS